MNSMIKALPFQLLVGMVIITGTLAGCREPGRKESIVSVMQTDSITEMNNGIVKCQFQSFLGV